MLNYIYNNSDRTWSHWEYVTIIGDEQSDINENNEYEFPLISFEEWQSLPDVPKPEYDPKYVAFETKFGQKFTQNKTLIGYKIVKEEYEKQALEIASENCLTKEWNTKKNIDFHVGTNFYNNLLKSGILDLWFEPVFEKESITLKSGVKLSEEDIAEVKEIIEIRQVCKDLAKEKKY